MGSCYFSFLHLVILSLTGCGHCKNMKPAYAEAAKLAKEKGLVGKFAAVDCTQETELATKYGVKGFPTRKIYFPIYLFSHVHNQSRLQSLL